MGAICPQNAPKFLGSGPRADPCGISLFHCPSNPISPGTIKLPIILFIYTSRAWRFMFANRPIQHPFPADCPACSPQSLKATGGGRGQRRLWSVLPTFPGPDNRDRAESASGYRGWIARNSLIDICCSIDASMPLNHTFRIAYLLFR
jgi:hypothetical protein